MNVYAFGGRGRNSTASRLAAYLEPWFSGLAPGAMQMKALRALGQRILPVGAALHMGALFRGPFSCDPYRRSQRQRRDMFTETNP